MGQPPMISTNRNILMGTGRARRFTSVFRQFNVDGLNGSHVSFDQRVNAGFISEL